MCKPTLGGHAGPDRWRSVWSKQDPPSPPSARARALNGRQEHQEDSSWLCSSGLRPASAGGAGCPGCGRVLQPPGMGTAPQNCPLGGIQHCQPAFSSSLRAVLWPYCVRPLLTSRELAGRAFTWCNVVWRRVPRPDRPHDSSSRFRHRVETSNKVVHPQEWIHAARAIHNTLVPPTITDNYSRHILHRKLVVRRQLKAYGLDTTTHMRGRLCNKTSETLRHLDVCPVVRAVFAQGESLNIPPPRLLTVIGTSADTPEAHNALHLHMSTRDEKRTHTKR